MYKLLSCSHARLGAVAGILLLPAVAVGQTPLIAIDDLVATGAGGSPRFSTDFSSASLGALAEDLTVPGMTFTSDPPGTWIVALTFFSTLADNVLYQPDTPGTLDIAFTTPVTNFSCAFAENQPVGASSLVVTAFSGTTAIGSVVQTTTTGGFGEGVVTFASATAFDRVRLSSILNISPTPTSTPSTPTSTPLPTPITFNKVQEIDAMAGPNAGPQAIALADVNQDARLDVLVVRNDKPEVSVFLNNGGGHFGAANGLATGEGPVAVTAGDFDRDGNLDIAIVNRTAGTVTVHFGNGQGAFDDSGREISVTPDPVGLVAADLNGDDIDDLAVLTDASVSLWKSNGDRTFSPFAPESVSTRGGGAFAIAAGRIDMNASMDLVISNSASDNVSVLLGNGNGTFQAARLEAVGSRPEGLVLADLNGDAQLDIAVVAAGAIADLNVSLLYGHGDGTFEGDIPTTAGVASTAIVAADFDADGRVDLAVTNTGEGGEGAQFGLSILRNDPSGSGTSGNDNGFALSDLFGVAPSVAVRGGDLTGDGRPDLVALDQTGAVIAVLVNTSEAAARCVGDCNSDRHVAADELPTVIRMALGHADLTCANADANQDGSVTINEILRAVNNARTECGGP